MVQVGKYNTLKIVKHVDFGLYLDGGESGEILLPKRYVPKDAKIDEDLAVFIYHDSENRLVATTEHPIGTVGEIVSLEVVSITEQGAFMDWGLMKDIFVPLSQQQSRMQVGYSYLVMIYIDAQTGRVAATEKIDKFLSNLDLTVKELEEVDLVVYRKSDLGYVVIINSKHLGLLHFNEVFRELEYGESLKGFIKKILPENKIDVVLGKRGYEKVMEETDKILELLQENNGYLPYHDKSDPKEIYDFFGMSKKTFKMTLGKLFKEKKIELTKTGFKLVE